MLIKHWKTEYFLEKIRRFPHPPIAGFLTGPAAEPWLDLATVFPPPRQSVPGHHGRQRLVIRKGDSFHTVQSFYFPSVMTVMSLSEKDRMS
jgi:hypothetical protein